MRKIYQIFYEIKANNREQTNHMYVWADNVKEAKQKVKEEVMKQTGRHAFHLRSEAQQIKIMEEWEARKAEMGL